ncbi:MAG TPA: hypothetical protein EYG67_01070 [Campylobacterales bacterium]|nr:hypothetical protein [Campylobacterales bacterium]HIP41640.1 hypothetical protein [Campylobacterales bacterium]
MQEHDIDIEALKKDENFIADMKKYEEEMYSEKSIAKGYQLLGTKLAIEASEDEINEIFTFIVGQAFDVLAENLTIHKGFSMNDPEELSTARAIYEHGIQRYSENDIKGAKEIFLVLHHTIEDDELKDAMMIHACAVMSGNSFDKFIEDLADTDNIDESDPTAFFIKEFKQPTDILLTMFSKYVALGKADLKVLEAGK